MNLFPLQTSYLKTTDPTLAIILFVVIGIVIVILLAYNIAKNGIGSDVTFGGASQGTARFSRWALRRAVASCGLDSKQTAMLESIFRMASVADPVKALDNPPLLDRIFKRAFRLIETSEENEAVAEGKKAQLFSVRNAISSAGGSSTKISSTRQIAEGTIATIMDPDGEKYPVKVLSTHGERLALEMPKNALGEAVRIARGAKLTISFHDRARQGYRFETRVASLSTNSFDLAHADHITALPSRRFQRAETNIACYFSAVHVELQTVGRKTVKKTIADDRRTIGNIMDLSAGGCAIKTSSAMKAGDYLKLEFDSRGRTVAALGRIVRTNKMGSVGGIMHIQFAKVPQRTFNAINALVYGFDQD